MKAQLSKATNNPYGFLQSDAWGMQRKIDGWRCLLQTGGPVTTLNRRGEPLQCPDEITTFFTEFTQRWVFDGEILDGKYFIFDILEIPTGNITSWTLSRRYELLEMLSTKLSAPVNFLPLYTSVESKTNAFHSIQSSKGEGVVFKLLEAPYVQRRTSTSLKYKFVKQVDCYVTALGVGGKANMVLSMYDGQTFVEVGKCSALTADGPKVKVGDVVQVDILYTTEHGRLYQPVAPKLRGDKLPKECSYSQIAENQTLKQFDNMKVEAS